MGIAEELKKRINEAPSLHSVAAGAGLDYAILYRFATSERDIKLANVQKLCDFFRLELKERRTKRKPPKRKVPKR